MGLEESRGANEQTCSLGSSGRFSSSERNERGSRQFLMRWSRARHLKQRLLHGEVRWNRECMCMAA